MSQEPSKEHLVSLIERYRKGDQEAASELFHAFSGQMAALASRMVREHFSKSAIDVEGIVNSGFRSFFSAVLKPSFDSRAGQIGGLLATIVSRKALVRLRRKYPTTLEPDDFQCAVDVFAKQSLGDLSDLELTYDMREVIAPVIADLTEKEQRLLIAMLDPSDERSIDEIAIDHKSSLITAHNLFDSVQAQLRAQLIAKGA